jgi:hypothetical protein
VLGWQALTASSNTQVDPIRERHANSAATDELLLKPSEVAELCRCSAKTVMRAILAGELEASQLGRRGTWVGARQRDRRVA